MTGARLTGRSRPRLLAVALAWLLVGISLAGGSIGTARPVTAQESLSETGTYLIEVQTGRTVRIGENALVAWSPDSSVVAVSENGETSRPPLRLITMADGTEQQIALPGRGGADVMRWAPDGSRLAIVRSPVDSRNGPVLGVVDPATGAYRQFAAANIGDIAWTPDSTGITAITMEEAGGSVVTIDAATGEVRETFPDVKDASCQRGLAWSADGRFLAYGGPGLLEGCGDVGNWGLWTLDPATRTTRQLFQGPADAPLWLATGEVVAIVAEPREDGIPPLSLFRFAPEGGEPGLIVRDIARMFPQPPRLMQVVGNSVLYPISTCAQGEAYLWTPERAAPARVTPTSTYAYRAALAPDGQSLAFVRIGQRSEIVMMSVDGGEERVPLASSVGLEVGTTSPWGAGDDWSPDGRWLAIEVTSEQLRDCVE